MSEQQQRDPSTRLLPTSARGMRTRSALLAAAREVFLRDGYAETTATGVTTLAGVGYGSFYVYFSSKQALFVEVAHELMEEVYRDSRAPQEQLEPYDRLLHETRRYFELYRANVRLFDLLQEAVHTDAEVRKAWLELRRDYLTRLARSISRLQAEGRMCSTLDPRYTAECLGAMAERTAQLSTLDPEIDLEQLLRAVTSVWGVVLGLVPAPVVSRRRPRKAM